MRLAVATDPDSPVRLTGDLDMVAGASTAHVSVAGAAGVRALAVLGLGVGVLTDVTVTVSAWRRPLAGWSGRLGAVARLVRCEVDVPTGRDGEVTVRLVVDEPTDLAAVARALVPLLEPVRADARRGSPRVAVAPGSSPHVAALLLDPRVSPVRLEPDADAIRGNDVLLRGPSSPAVPDEQVARVVEVDADGTLADGADAPQVDLTVHRPVGRLRSTAAGVPAVLQPRTDGWTVQPVTASSGAAAVTVPAYRPLDADDVAALRRVTSLDLSRVPVPTDDGARRRLTARLTELAAVGVELHDGRALTASLRGLDPAVVAALALPRGDRGLARALRTTRQRRAAASAHGGVLRLARHLAGATVEDAGLPSVSVLLVSRRPDLLPTVLDQLAAQTYRNLEVVVVVHGERAFEVPARLRGLVTHSVALGADVPFGAVLAHATTLADGELLTKVDDDDLYGPHHVWDLVLAWLSSGAQVVGKRAQYVYVAERDVTVHRKLAVENVVKVVAGGTMLLSAADLAAVGGWRPVPRSVDRGLLERLHEAGGSIYATEGLGYVYVRHGDGHTWAVEADALLTNVLEQWPGLHRAVLDEEPLPTS